MRTYRDSWYDWANDDLTAYISVVAISNDTRMMESVGSRALSSFTPEDVHFDDYDANQLKAILRRRQDAFHDGVVDGDVIPLAAAFAAQTHGDARKAIDLMGVAGELAEREGDDRVQEEHVREAQEKVEKNRVLEVVRGISAQKKLCLYATAMVAAETDNGTARSTTGYRVYQFLVTSHRYYFYSEDLDSVSPAELCCHTLLIDDGTRHRSYCLLLLSHVNVDDEDLRGQAANYGLETEIDALIQYLETHGEVEDDRLPAWSEFQELAADYEVTLP